MKTAEELFLAHCKTIEWASTTDSPNPQMMYYNHFLSALTEHDSEIIQIINEMIKEESTMWKRGRYRIEALTELKQKLR
jgi:muramidase (phage lysozyme)